MKNFFVSIRQFWYTRSRVTSLLRVRGKEFLPGRRIHCAIGRRIHCGRPKGTRRRSTAVIAQSRSNPSSSTRDGRGVLHRKIAHFTLNFFSLRGVLPFVDKLFQIHREDEKTNNSSPLDMMSFNPCDRIVRDAMVVFWLTSRQSELLSLATRHCAPRNRVKIVHCAHQSLRGHCKVIFSPGAVETCRHAGDVTWTRAAWRGPSAPEKNVLHFNGVAARECCHGNPSVAVATRRP